MVEISGRTIIDHQLDWLAAAGVEHVVVSCGHLAEVLQDHLKAQDHPLEVRTAVESEPLGRGGGLRFAGNHLPDPHQPWFATNGDIWTRFDLNAMSARHFESGATATLALARPRIPWGAVQVDEAGSVVDFQEAPPLPYPINAGVYVFGPEVIDLLPERGDHERTMFPQLAGERRLGGFEITGFWRAIDTLKDLQEAARELAALGENA